MKRSRGGWGQSHEAKPAAEVDVRLGRGLLRETSARFPRYLVIASPRIADLVRPHLAQEPAAIRHPTWCDFQYLQALSDSLPTDAELVVGMGGGMALDAAKHVALAKNLPLILVPTVVSTSAMIRPVFARRDGRLLVGDEEDWPWIECEYVLVDLDIVLAAPYYLNTAGLGDILCSYGGLAEWRRNAELGVGPAWDDKILGPTVEQLASIVDYFPKTLTPLGDLTEESVRYIMEAIRERDAKSVQHPAFVYADHHFYNVIELVNDCRWVHGEIVALGATIVTWMCRQHPEELLAKLKACKVRHRPSQMGVSREELWKGLEAVPPYFAKKNINSIMRQERFSIQRFEQLWEFLENT